MPLRDGVYGAMRCDCAGACSSMERLHLFLGATFNFCSIHRNVDNICRAFLPVRITSPDQVVPEQKVPVSYWDNSLNAEPAAKYFVASEKEGKELNGDKNIFQYLTLVLQLKSSPVSEIYSLVWWREQFSRDFYIFFQFKLLRITFLITLCQHIC